ncbi:MAG: bifunctional adenosylcobinamide kinase/adenosylcobinamide-phosphate guanylyltransferase, partial [Aestuariivirgaceae bacterium]
GARSGKSRHAEELANKHQGERIYIATAEPGDEEMQRRISNHRRQRGTEWVTIEEPIELPSALKRECGQGRLVLVDCITLWLSNLMLRERDIGKEIDHLCMMLPGLDGTLIFVSNEVGLGIVPENELARRFRDEAGVANQRIAAACDEVVVMFAGLALKLKG